MTDPLRSDPAADAAELPERDRDARVEELLLSGLDHYFNGQHELAINVWTRVLFIDRGHARARAYIERARSAVSERQREGEELIHAGAAAFERGDADAARRMLTAALERGAVGDEALALLDRLQRLEAAGVQGEPHPRRGVISTATRRRRDEAQGGSGMRLVWIAAGVLLGMLLAAALMVWMGRDGRLATPDTLDAAGPQRSVTLPLPVPTPSEISLARARELYEKGRLREALPLLEQVRHGDVLRPQADELRATIQQQLLDSRPRQPLLPASPGSRP